ncbi:MAG: hypothetical protein HOK97_15570 [Deltaproteobacteria bacterium]|jgi:acyl carrier protein|nr:hypothetical protein [Planctomycetaceae bacterium]MBT6431842.1 hypothetical protein [Deltaproteobacteria bacterium]MBT6491190.1 hypothetical protein [Deltaproteobacteria bacterium]
MSVEVVKEILVDVLGVDDSDIKEDANLIDDLAVESIDFIDIAYGIEQEVDGKVNPGDIFPAFLREADLFDTTGALNKEVTDKLEKDYSHIRSNVIADFSKSQDPNVFFSVQVLSDFISHRASA